MRTAVRKSLPLPAKGQARTAGSAPEAGVVLEYDAPLVPRAKGDPSRLENICEQVPFAAAARLATCPHARVPIASDTPLLRESLSWMLPRLNDVEITGFELSAQLTPDAQLRQPADILWDQSKAGLSNDLQVIRNVRSVGPPIGILLLGMSGGPVEFLHCVRCGVQGFLLRESSFDGVLIAVRALHKGEFVCPVTLCALLYRYFEREACSLPSASIHDRLGLIGREQQIIPLIAKGRTNKEIASHFSRSEQTVKNHLYRIKHKIGGSGRLGIVPVCRSQGLLVQSVFFEVGQRFMPGSRTQRNPSKIKNQSSFVSI